MQLQQVIGSYDRLYGRRRRRIQHFIKVHALAQLIGRQEQLNERMQFILEAAALTHDIGIKNGEAKFGAGKCSGKTQELEGPPAAAELLAKLGLLLTSASGMLFDWASSYLYQYRWYGLSDLVEADFW